MRQSCCTCSIFIILSALTQVLSKMKQLPQTKVSLRCLCIWWFYAHSLTPASQLNVLYYWLKLCAISLAACSAGTQQTTYMRNNFYGVITRKPPHSLGPTALDQALKDAPKGAPGHDFQSRPGRSAVEKGPRRLDKPSRALLLAECSGTVLCWFRLQKAAA